MKQFKIMIAILIMATAGLSLAVDGVSDTFTGTNTFTGTVESGTYQDGSIQNGNNSGQYDSGAFNFTENSAQEVTSDIGGNAVVHGDSSANVAGNQNNCFEAGSCINGDNGGVIQTLTAGSGNILNGGDLGGHFVTLEVPLMTYENIDGDFVKTQVKYTEADVTAGIEVDGVVVQVGQPKFKIENQWVAYNNTEAALIQSNNNVAAQKIAANANTTQTVISAPSMSAPSINASNSDMCRHGVSGSGSMVGLGFSAGVTLIDKNCELLKQVRLLSNLGLKDVALALLGQDERVALAMFQADPERYSQFLNADTVRSLEEDSANAEAIVNGEEVKYQNADADQEIIDGDINGSDDDKQAKSLGANGYPLGDLLNLPIFNWLN